MQSVWNMAIHHMQRLTSVAKDYAIFVGLAYQGKDIVFRLVIEYSSLRDFGP
jgi:hypothetical protein